MDKNSRNKNSYRNFYIYCGNSYLKPVYEDGEIWDDERNLIVIKIYTYEEINNDQKDGLLDLASTLVEFKPSVNHRVDFLFQKLDN